MRALRKLVLGETWTLPLGVFLTLALGLVLDAAAGDGALWRHAGGFLLLACVLLALAVSLAPAWWRPHQRR
jgi:hypothetical protein